MRFSIKDIDINMDFHKTRMRIKMNTNLIDGVALETIPLVGVDYSPAIVLIHRDWRRMYFVREKLDFTDDDYFEYANKMIQEHGIENP